MLVGLSLIGTAVFHRDNREDRYVPGEVTAGGAVHQTKGYFEKAPHPAMKNLPNEHDPMSETIGQRPWMTAPETVAVFDALEAAGGA